MNWSKGPIQRSGTLLRKRHRKSTGGTDFRRKPGARLAVAAAAPHVRAIDIREPAMTTKTALFALLAVWGVGTGAGLPAFADESASDESASASPAQGPHRPGFTDRVWSRVDDGDLPGVIRIFLSDGTLVQDSCWETHRLSSWQLVSSNTLQWSEDGETIDAEIVSLQPDELVLSLKLRSDTVTEHYTAATVPSVCPDMPKS
jgi:hypothetical protein